MPRPVMTSPQRKRRNNMKKSKLPAQASKLRSVWAKAGKRCADSPHSKSTSCEMCETWIEFREAFGVRTRPRVAFREAANLERDFHSIVGDPDFDMSLDGDGTEFRRHFAFITGDNLRTAMRNDGFRHALFFTPCQLGPNRRVTDECFAAFANKRARNRGTIANVDLHPVERCTALVNEDQVGRVENAGTPGAHAISDRRRKNGMFDRERFECDPTNFRRRTLFDQPTLLNGIMP